MHTQINIPTNSESGILPQQGISNTFQKDKSRQEILGHRLVKPWMNYAHIVNLEASVRSPFD